MSKEEIGYLVLLFLALFMIFLFVIILTIRKQMPVISQAKTLATDQRQTVIFLKAILLEYPVSYYHQTYTYQMIFQDIYSKKEIVLYATKDQQFDILEKEDYLITHDGLVLFEARRSYFT